jgi:proline dehydrogenase
VEQVGVALNQVFRRGILTATHAGVVARFVRRYGMRMGASRFVAGETLDEAVPVFRSLNADGLRANTTLLGEHVQNEAEARAVAETYLGVLDRIVADGLQVNIALKLTHLGLDLGEEIAWRNVREVVAHAARVGNFVRLDMEDSARVDPTLRIYRRLREDGLDNVGAVLQAMLYRTPDDLASLLPLKPNLRLVKGAYL